MNSQKPQDLIFMGELMAVYWILEKLTMSGIILCMRPANEQQCYNATSSLIGWAHTQNDPAGYNGIALHHYTDRIFLVLNQRCG